MAKALCNKFYTDARGEVSKYVQPDSVAVGFDVLDPNHVPEEGEAKKVLASYSMLMVELPYGIQTQLMLLGAAQKVGDRYTRKSGMEIAESIEVSFDQLRNGVWSERASGDGETRPTMLLEAIVAAIVAIHGESADTPEIRDHYKAEIATKEGREAAMNTPAVKAEYTKLQKERAAERAAKAAEEAVGVEANAFLTSFTL